MDLSNVSILNLMPPNIASDKNVKMAAQAFDEVLRDIIKKIPNVAVISNLILNKIVDEVLIDLLAWQFHVDFYDPKMPINIKRELVMKSLDWHFRKGTPSVVEDLVTTVFSKAEIQEWFEYEGLPYRFRIYTEEQLPNVETLENFIQAIKSVKNTRSWFDTITSIARTNADANIGIVPEIGKRAHILARENEPYVFFGIMPRMNKSVHILASENEPHGYHGIVPRINMRVDILSLEV